MYRLNGLVSLVAGTERFNEGVPSQSTSQSAAEWQRGT